MPGSKAKFTTEERFWSKVAKGDGDACWEWTAGKMGTGYGELAMKCADGWRPRKAHRLSWEINVGPIPAGLCVLHRCDNRGCVRPDHLFLGTIQDNSDDMVSKGRGRGNPNPPQGDDHRLRRHPELVLRGERNPCAKLTMKQAAEILRRYQPRGRDSGARLAREFGVSPSAVSLIIRGKHWREVGNARA